MASGAISPSVIFSTIDPNFSVSLAQGEHSGDYGKAHLLSDNLLGSKPSFTPVVRANGSGVVGHIDISLETNIQPKINILPTIVDDSTGLVVEASLDFGLITETQYFTINLWNISRGLDANLTSIQMSNGEGVVISGPGFPYMLRARTHVQFQVAVTTEGNANADTTIEFIFSDGPNPDILQLTGIRAVPLTFIPEAPVSETWEWKTDILTSNDGTEQRHALRGSNPRVSHNNEYVVDGRQLINKMNTHHLLEDLQFWVPEWQYLTKILQKTNEDESRLYFNVDDLDLRVGEFLIIQLLCGESVLKQIATVEVDGVTLVTPLDLDIPAMSIVTTGGVAYLKEGLKSSRYPVDDVARVNYTTTYQRGRESLLKPGTVSESTQFLSRNVLDKRPLADSLVEDTVVSGNTLLDNKIGIMQLFKLWKYPRISGDRTYKVDRREEMNFWRHFFTEVKGMAKAFWLPTYRSDLTPAEPVGVGVQNLLVEEALYAEQMFARIPTHRWIQIETSAGFHYAEVTSALIDSEKSRIIFNPALPSGAGWNEVIKISFLLPCRLNSDSVEWEHHNLHSFVTIKYRTAE